MSSSVNEAKSAAKRLRARLSNLGVAISHSQSLEATSAVLTGQDWNRHLVQSKSHQPKYPPAEFLLSRPGDGGWDYLRKQDMDLLRSHPDGFVVWCFPDHLKLPIQPANESEGAHVFSAIEGVKSVATTQTKDLMAASRGKILTLIGPPSFGMPEEAMQCAQSMFHALKESRIGGQALRVRWVDIHRWTFLPQADGLLGEMRKTGWPVTFQTQIESDLEKVARHFPVSAAGARLETHASLLGVVKEGLSMFRHPVGVLPYFSPEATGKG